MSGWGRAVRRPLRVVIPWSDAPALPTVIVTPVTWWRRPATVLAVAIPLLLVLVGVVTAVAGAFAEQRERTEALGAFAVEAGAALWFAGAVTLGARRGATVLRALALLAIAVVGVALVVLAVVLDWRGAPLTLAMEFGVGALAVAVIDVVLLGAVHARLEQVASQPDDVVVNLEVGRSWRLVDVTVSAPDRAT